VYLGRILPEWFMKSYCGRRAAGKNYTTEVKAFFTAGIGEESL